MDYKDLKISVEVDKKILDQMVRAYREVARNYELKKIADLAAEIDRAIEAEQAEIWRSDPLQILPKISAVTGLKWRRGPIGAWNSQRVVGASISVKIQFRHWFWKFQWSRWAEWSFWLCFGLGFKWEYGNVVEEPKQKPIGLIRSAFLSSRSAVQ